jgi:hypothetical protein
MKLPIQRAIDQLAEQYEIPAERILRADMGKDGSIWLATEGEHEEHWFRYEDELKPVLPGRDPKLPLCQNFDFQDSKVRVLAWRPRRRIAIRIENADGFEVLKGLRPKKLEPTLHAYQHVRRHLTASDDFLVPSATRVPELAAIRMPGLNLDPIEVSMDNASVYRRVGRALAGFQERVPCAGLAVRGFKQELGVLDELAERHMQGMGKLPVGWDRECRRLHDYHQLDQQQPVSCHRDLHDGQLMHAGERVALLDFDLLAKASPLLDLGNLSAHFFLRALQREAGSASGDAEACELELLAGYDLSDKSPVQGELRAYKCSSFLRLALLYSMRPKWQHLATPLVQLAKQCLDESSKN